ncbi:nitrilase-related carbon-nitrogen hydrolase [Embleya sp. NPDC008237]|uniref:nitrilase-related carbon-nitrogen hydrolase n=1 Tax=Embleya sp. NPDC008237 TaxID=3363978 RepID=UPI0036EDB3B2
MTETLVACAQLALSVGDVAGNRRAALAAIERAAAAGADVLVLPELVNSGYVLRDAAEAAALAEPVDGPTVTGWVEAARRHDLIVVGGFAERDADGAIRNSAVLVDPSGVRACYRKVHLWGREAELFVPGRELPPVVETAKGRIAVLVCYDVEFPEWVRTATLRDADLLCAPVNWPYAPRPAGERPAEDIRVQADAAVNRVFIAACDRAGPERGTSWVGGSIIVDPDGFPLAGPPAEDAEHLLLARCRLTDARDKRIGAHNDVFADRRPELYGSILTPTADRGAASGDRAGVPSGDRMGVASGDRAGLPSDGRMGVASGDRAGLPSDGCMGVASGDRAAVAASDGRAGVVSDGAVDADARTAEGSNDAGGSNDAAGSNDLAAAAPHDRAVTVAPHDRAVAASDDRTASASDERTATVSNDRTTERTER